MTGPSSSGGRKQARIEIIPFIDVVFFLLATFILFTLSLNKIMSVPVNLPVADAKPQPPNPDDETVTIQISDSGTAYWDRELINVSEIGARIDQYKTQVRGEPRILIAGDDRAKFGITVQVLDQVRKAGIKQVSVETRTRPTGR